MREHYGQFFKEAEPGRIRNHVSELASIEKQQTYPAYRKAAEYVFERMKEYGIPEPEIMEFPADGTTVFHDVKMPLAWNVSSARLDVLSPDRKSPVFTAADYQVHPFHLIQGSVSTPENGIDTEIITIDEFRARNDVRNMFVLTDPDKNMNPPLLRAILDRGAAGFVTDWNRQRVEEPDSLQWITACTESRDWHVTGEDRPFIGFCISPRSGDRVRQMLRKGPVYVHAESNARRYPGTFPLVTARVPGRQKKELWVAAHMFEPLLNDDSTGVIASLEIARMIMKCGTPEYSIRLIFTMELYGLAAYTAFRGGCLKDQVIGGCNFDAIGSVMREPLELWEAGPAVPFAGNRLIHVLQKEFSDVFPMVFCGSSYADDLFIGDSTIGVPMTWLMGQGGGYWHHSRQTDPAFINWELLQKNIAAAACYLYELSNCREIPQPRKKNKAAEISSPLRTEASKLIFRRASTGFPFSLAKVPPKERITLPDGIIYGPFANILSNMDGFKTMEELIFEAEGECGRRISEEEVKNYMECAVFLAHSGYLEQNNRS